jgi:DNA-binding LacI/PurR family transcriptional regulator
MARMTRRMADVALRAGVSESTVSRVLNGKPGVAESTKVAVMAALDVLGYERPTFLRGDKVRIVGLVVPELQNPIFPMQAEVVAAGLVQRGVAPVLCTGAAGGLSEPAYVDLLLQQQASGVVFFGGARGEADDPHAHFTLLRDRHVPAVVVNATVEGLGFPTVAVDDAEAVRLSLNHLRSLGHERIGAVFGPAGHLPSERKMAAMLAVGGGFGFELEKYVEHTMFTSEGGAAATVALLERGATAAIYASDLLALGGIKGARRAGRRVPTDFSVIGFDDSPLMTSTDPALTTVRQPVEAMGKATVTLLMEQIEHGPHMSRELLFEPELVVRATTDAAPR